MHQCVSECLFVSTSASVCVCLCVYLWKFAFIRYFSWMCLRECVRVSLPTWKYSCGCVFVTVLVLMYVQSTCPVSLASLYLPSCTLWLYKYSLIFSHSFVFAMLSHPTISTLICLIFVYDSWIGCTRAVGHSYWPRHLTNLLNQISCLC
jgi:hypothetical protein